MEQTINTVQNFLTDVERLVGKEIPKGYIKKTRIKHLGYSRESLEKIEEPLRTLALRLLDETTQFALIFNENGAEAAEECAEKAYATMSEIGQTAEKVINHGI